ncbi:MAG: uracil-DNA glycosylase [Methylococcaceae bacterium]
MDNVTRLQYLEAMGIAVWLPRVAVDQLQVPDAKVKLTDNWESLQAEVSRCKRCDLCETRKSTVSGAGNINAEWLIVGEAPGLSEDQQGLPFVGKTGLLLTEMLRAINLAREDVFITNVLKCRPPDNREPKSHEVETCKTYLLREHALLKPKIILALGHVAAQALLNTQEPLVELRGKVHALNDTPLVVVYHPAYLLRSLLGKRKAWEDLKFAMQTVKNCKG